MEGKLRILMQSENLTASRLAEILEVKPAAISHILSGRNKPSFELLCKIVTRFPQINPYWLLGDAKEMRNAEATISTSDDQVPSSGTLFDLSSKEFEKSDNSDINQNKTIASSLPLSRYDIEKIIIVYSDHTFEELQPKK
uniref:helix-turn-helix domain-containing protein n=1 Tax=Alistipes sp. TaxID=1872444 RepID=UPI00405630AF